MLLWEYAPNTYRRVDGAAQLAALGTHPPVDRAEKRALPANAATSRPASLPAIETPVATAWDPAAIIAGMQADQAREEALAAEFGQALREGMQGGEPEPS